MNRTLIALVFCLFFALSAPASETKPEELFSRPEHPSLGTLMRDIREHFVRLVERAYFTGVLIPMQPKDYEDMAGEAREIGKYIGEAETHFSRGPKFDHWAKELLEHAQKVEKAAGKQELAEVNVEIGEMAEYCAKCHYEFRWKP